MRYLVVFITLSMRFRKSGKIADNTSFLSIYNSFIYDLNWLASASGPWKFVHFFLRVWGHMHQNVTPYTFKKSYMKDVCVVCWIERKLIFPILNFWVMVILVLKTTSFRCIFKITRKIKIGKFVFHSIQNIAHLSWKLEKNWEGGGEGFCISLLRTGPIS